MNYKIFALLAITSFFTLLSKAQSEISVPADTVSMPTYDLLDEVVIEAERPVIQSNGAKTTYNVDEDPSSGSATVLDMLKKVPMVSVDGEGKVRLNGESNFKFQINGQDNPMLQQYADQVLQAMPASAVAKIEVITEPGAKEDAEGTVGIINFITERASGNQDSLSGNIGLSASNRTLGPSFFIAAKKRNVTFSANMNYQWGYNANKSETENNTHYLSETNPGFLKSNTSQSGKFHYLGGNLNFSWEPNTKNLFTFSANIFSLNAKVKNLINKNIFSDNSGNPLWSFDQDGNVKLNIFNISSNLSYRHNFSETKNYLIVSYLFNFGRTNMEMHQWITGMQNYIAADDYTLRNSTNFNRGHTLQIDYANDFNSEKHLLEAGAKGIIRYNTAIASYQGGPSEEDLILYPSLGTDVDQPQNIYALYASYTGNFNSLSVVGGLRYEHTKMGINYKENPSMNFTSRLNDLVPNAALTWSFTPTSNLRLSYQMRISRPSIEQVNPFELSISPYEIRKGNPDLKSEHSHKVALSYTNFGRVFGGSVTMEYTRINNSITSYLYLRQMQYADVMVNTFSNIGKNDNMALRGFLNWNIINGMSLSANGGVSFVKLQDPSQRLTNSGWIGNIGGAWNYRVNQVYKFAAYGGYMARRINLQGYDSGYYYYGISASKDFLADKSLTLGLSLTNFALTTMKFKSHTETSELISNNVWKNLAVWNVGVSITWKFGSGNTQVKTTGADVNNDDINRTSNSNQGSSNTQSPF